MWMLAFNAQLSARVRSGRCETTAEVMMHVSTHARTHTQTHTTFSLKKIKGDGGGGGGERLKQYEQGRSHQANIFSIILSHSGLKNRDKLK